MSLITYQKKNTISRSTRVIFWGTVVLAVVAFLIQLLLPADTSRVVNTAFPTPQLEVVEKVDSDVKIKLTVPAGFELLVTTDGSSPLKNGVRYKGSAVVSLNRQLHASGLPWIPTSPRWKPPIGKVEREPFVRAVATRNDTAGPEKNEVVVTRDNHLAIVSIVAEEDSLLSFERGVLVMGKKYEDKDNYVRKNVALSAPWWEYPANYQERGADWERPVKITVNGDRKSNWPTASVRVHGSATRGFAQKSLRIYSGEETGFFTDARYKLCDENVFVLRNGGNDWDRAFIRDAIAQRIYSRMAGWGRKVEPAEVYLNGWYWGLYYAAELQDACFISSYTGIPPDSLMILDADGTIYHGEVSEQDRLLFRAKNLDQMSGSQIASLAHQTIDLENFTDYLILNLYLDNRDWPHANFRIWKTSGQNTLWRWIPTDLDMSMGFTSGKGAASFDSFSRLYNSGSFTGRIFRALMEDSSYREILRERMAFHLTGGLSQQTTIGVLDSLSASIQPSMGKQIARWATHGGFKDWQGELETVKAFLTGRREPFISTFEAFLVKFEQRRETL